MHIRSAILTVLLATGLILSASPFAVNAAPSTPASGHATSYSPRDQLNALLATPFPAELLPAGMSNPEVSQWTDFSDRDLVGAIGGAKVVLNDGPTTGIYYVIYQSDEQAASYFQQNLSTATTAVPTIASTSEQQGTRVAISNANGDVCVEQFANVVVIGGVGSDQSVADKAGTACALVDAGITHLDTIVLQQPPPVPEPQTPPTPLDQLNLLISSPFPADLLPAGHSDPVVSEWPYGDSDLAGAVGGVVINLDGSDTTGISFIVYPTIEIAQTQYGGIANSLGTPTDDVLPDQITAIADTYAICGALANNVLVLGASTIDASGDIVAATTDACALVQAGENHLQQLATSAATPAAATPVPATPKVESGAGGLFNALANADFPGGNLPPAFTNPVVQSDDQTDDAFGLVGKIFVQMNGDDLTGISYLVYPNKKAAQAWLEANAISIGTDFGPIGGEDGNSWESYLVTSSTYVQCIAVSGSVAVIGVVPADTQSSASAACSLTLAGLGHLQDVTGK